MTFSIILPTHNGDKRIWRMLESIRKQTFTDYEVLAICDDCSDNTKEVVRAYGCRVFECDYHNGGMARNIGLENAKGKWIMFADDDDWWVSDYALEQIYAEILTMKEEPDIIQCAFVFGKNGVTQTLNNRVWPNVWSKIWRRESIGETRFPNVYPDDDLKFVEAMLRKGSTVMCMPILWYYHNYMRPGSITWTLEQEKLLKEKS